MNLMKTLCWDLLCLNHFGWILSLKGENNFGAIVLFLHDFIWLLPFNYQGDSWNKLGEDVKQMIGWKIRTGCINIVCFNLSWKQVIFLFCFAFLLFLKKTMSDISEERPRKSQVDLSKFVLDNGTVVSTKDRICKSKPKNKIKRMYFITRPFFFFLFK